MNDDIILTKTAAVCIMLLVLAFYALVKLSKKDNNDSASRK